MPLSSGLAVPMRGAALRDKSTLTPKTVLKPLPVARFVPAMSTSRRPLPSSPLTALCRVPAQAISHSMRILLRRRVHTRPIAIRLTQIIIDAGSGTIVNPHESP